MTEPAMIPQTDLTKLRSRLRNPDIWAPALLVLLGILFFADPLFSSKNFYFRDILNFHYPLRKVLIESYSRGEFPLWNPFVSLGQPMLANPNYMAFYPTNLLHLFLPFNYAFKLHFILHPILAGVGLYFLQRRIGLFPIGALAGAMAYEFSGTVLSFLNLYNIIPAVALLPWIGWAFAGALEKNWFRRSLGFGALLALQVIAFEPLMFLCIVWLLAGLTLLHILESSRKTGALGRSLRVGLTGGVFAAGLAAVQVLPTLELLPRSARGSGLDFAQVTLWSMHPLDLLNSIIPNLFGYYYTINRTTSWGESLHNGRETYLVSFFAGSCIVLLAGLSFFSLRKKLQAVMACLALVGIVLASSGFNPVYQWLFDHVPLFRLGRYPSKYFLLTAMSISIMSSLGLEIMLRSNQLESRARRRFLVAGACGLVLALVLLGYRFAWPYHVSQLQSWVSSAIGPMYMGTKNMPAIVAQLERSVLSTGGFLLLGSVLVLIAPAWRKTSLMGGLVLLLIAAELMPANLRLSPLISDADVDYLPEVNKYLSRSGPAEPFRVAPPTLLRPMPDLHLRLPNYSSAWLTLFYRRSGQPYYGIMNGIQYSLYISVDHLGTLESEELRKATSLMPEPSALTLLAKLNTPVLSVLGKMHDPRARLLASFETGSDQNLNLYWLNECANRALFVPNVETASSQAEAFQKFIRPDFSFGNAVVLESSRFEARSGLPDAGIAKIGHYGNQRVLCRVEARTAGYLVLLDSYYPGWNAYLDGLKVNVMRANYAFRAVAVPAGSHAVEFRYRPKSFYWGFALSLITILSGILSVVVRARTRPQQ
jgi:hypothetical protein